MNSIRPAYFSQLAHPGTSAAPAADKGGPGDGKLKAGTYNLGAGNADAKTRIDATSRHLAQQVVGDGVDVVALQEVDVGTGDAAANLPEGFDDYNEYTLAQISAEEAGLQGEVAYTREETTDARGNPVVTITGTDAQGRTSSVTIRPEYFAQQQGGPDGRTVRKPTNADDPDATLTVYNAQVQSPDGVQAYNVVFGESLGQHNGGAYGNAVLLGPDATLARDANGLPDIALHDLGADDPGGENRTAVEVKIEAGGQQATVFSAHLTAGPNDDKAAVSARLTQYQTLAALAEASGDNTLLLGDFNTEGVETVGPLSGENDEENDPGFWSAGNPIDRIYVSGDVAATGREHVNGGGSDHSLLTWNIDLND